MAFTGTWYENVMWSTDLYLWGNFEKLWGKKFFKIICNYLQKNALLC